MLDTIQKPASARGPEKASRHPEFQRFLAQDLLFTLAMPGLRKLLHVLLLILALPAFAIGPFEGPGEGGGGDPMVQQFLNMGKRLGYFYKANPFHARLIFKAEDFEARMKLIEQSVKNEGAPDLVEFTEQVLRDKSGKEKAARFLPDTGTIQVNRGIWKSYSEEERLVLVTMEVAGLLKADARYETATALVSGHSAIILSIPLENDGAFSMPGMRMVGQDPDQFGRITAQDVLIDGGELASGAGKRLADFLDNPAGDAEWFALLEKAKAMKRPAYMVLTGPNGNRVALLSFYDTKYEDGAKGVAAYWLQVYKTRQVYTGPCVGEARELPVLQRVKSCFLNLENYGFLDTADFAKIGEEQVETAKEAWAKMGKQLKERLIYFFAMDTPILEDVLRTNFITDFSALVADPQTENWETNGFRTVVLRHSVAANGWEPSLVGPFPGTPFWVKAKKKKSASIRFLAALKALSSLGLGFIDSARHCKAKSETFTGPGLFPFAKMREYRRAGYCSDFPVHWRPRLEAELLNAMTKHGFYYDYPAETWRLDVSKGETK